MGIFGKIAQGLKKTRETLVLEFGQYIVRSLHPQVGGYEHALQLVVKVIVQLPARKERIKSIYSDHAP